MIDVGAGVVDYDYRGPVGVVVFNHGKEDFRVGKGDRVAQLILERISMAELQEVSSGPLLFQLAERRRRLDRTAGLFVTDFAITLAVYGVA